MNSIFQSEKRKDREISREDLSFCFEKFYLSKNTSLKNQVSNLRNK